MIQRIWHAIRTCAATLYAARDYNTHYLNSAVDLADLERRMRDLDRRTARFPEL